MMEDLIRDMIEKILDMNCMLVCEKGSWNRTTGAGPAGFRVSSITLPNGPFDNSKELPSPQNFFYNQSFSSGWSVYSGLDSAGIPVGDLIAPTVYRPVGIAIDHFGSIMITTDYNWMPSNSPPGGIDVIMENNLENNVENDGENNDVDSNNDDPNDNY